MTIARPASGASNMLDRKWRVYLFIIVIVASPFAVAAQIPGDSNYDGKISDQELLTEIDLWAAGQVTDYALLVCIDVWKQGDNHACMLCFV